MHRTLFEIGRISIRSYGVMLAIAFWIAIELSARIARKRGLDATIILDLGIVVLISSVVGSRLLYILTHISEYENDVLGIFRIWEGGLTFYGGLLAAFVFGISYLRRRGVPVGEVTDIVAPQIALGIAFARVGCFLNGCCFGKESTLPWACRFPVDSQAGWVMGGSAVHPVQLYGVIANLLIFLFLSELLKRSKHAGVVFYSFLVTYGIWRFAIDYIRHYEDHMYVGLLGGTMTWNQVVSIGVAAVGLILLLRLRLSSETA
jgi:phosphatidylglycerol:prolipoprotein diacylglycerol transferase